MPAFQDLTSLKFGRWTVLKRDADRRPGYPMWLCRCECGTEKVVRANILKNGRSRSCGCFNSEVHRAQCIARNTTHGASHSRTYHIWAGMIQRCTNPNDHKWHRYGAIGVTICARWRDSFEAFLADMGECPDGMSIDRIDSTGPYDAGNCRWADQRTQQNNRSNNHVIEYGGRRQTLMQWSRELGIDRHTLINRLKADWPLHKVLSNKRHGRGGKPLSE